MSKKPFDSELLKKEKIVSQESILHLLQKKPMRNKEICEKLEAKSNRISYHLQKLLELGKIEKNEDVYSFVKVSPSKLNRLIFTILEENKCGKKSLKEIFEKIKESSNDFNSLAENDLLTTLQFVLKTTISEINGKYSIEDWYLGERGICFVCRKRITDDQLKIGLTTWGEWDGTNLWPLHATCRPKLHKIADTSETSCSYCGLDLDSSYFGDSGKTNTNVQNALAILHGDPFSILFSNLGSLEQYNLPNVVVEQNVGFAHYKEKDGKKYHPYCLRIVEGEKSS